MIAAKPVDMPLFGSDELRHIIGFQQLFICQGEAAYRVCRQRELFAVGTHGTDVIPSVEQLRPLCRFKPVLWPRNDEEGHEHMRRVAEQLRVVSTRPVQFVDWPDAPKKGDAVDYFAARRTIKSLKALIRTHDIHVSEDDHLSEHALSTSRHADWPDAMADAAYIGPIGSIVKKLAPETEASPEAILVQLLVELGNAMGKHGHCTVEADTHHTNLNAVVVGGTGSRKGVSHNHSRRCMKRADPEWESDHIISGLSTGEGLINAVQDDDPQIPDKVALVFESEFASVFKVKGRDGNTLSTVLRQAWDGETLRTLTRNSPLKATGAHISIIGHITPEELRRLMTNTDAGNGFANRFLWVCSKRARYLPHGGNEVNINAEVQALREAIEYGRKAGRLRRDKEANALWEQRYRDLSSGRPGLLGAVTNRAEAQVTRLSLIYALQDKSPDIKRRHLEAALAVWDYCLASARFIFGAALGDALAEELDQVLAKHGADGMSRTNIYNFFGNNRSADEIAHVLGILAGQNRAVKRSVKGDGGRTVERWYPVMQNVNNVNNEISNDSEADGKSLDTLNTLNTYPVPESSEGDQGDHSSSNDTSTAEGDHSGEKSDHKASQQSDASKGDQGGGNEHLSELDARLNDNDEEEGGEQWIL